MWSVPSLSAVRRRRSPESAFVQRVDGKRSPLSIADSRHEAAVQAMNFPPAMLRRSPSAMRRSVSGSSNRTFGGGPSSSDSIHLESRLSGPTTIAKSCKSAASVSLSQPQWRYRRSQRSSNSSLVLAPELCGRSNIVRTRSCRMPAQNHCASPKIIEKTYVPEPHDLRRHLRDPAAGDRQSDIRPAYRVVLPLCAERRREWTTVIPGDGLYVSAPSSASAASESASLKHELPVLPNWSIGCSRVRCHA